MTTKATSPAGSRRPASALQATSGRGYKNCRSSRRLARQGTRSTNDPSRSPQRPALMAGSSSSVSVRSSCRADHLRPRRRHDPGSRFQSVRARDSHTADKAMFRHHPFIVHAPSFQLALVPARRVQGTIRDKDSGRPIAGLEIQARPYSTSTAAFPHWVSRPRPTPTANIKSKDSASCWATVCSSRPPRGSPTLARRSRFPPRRRAGTDHILTSP